LLRGFLFLIFDLLKKRYKIEIMKEKITIKDIHKERVAYLNEEGFSESKAMELIAKILVWVAESGISISDLPLVVINEDRSFEVCIPIKEAKLKEEKEFKIKLLSAHRVGSVFHRETDKPLNLSEGFLERQLKYQGFKLLWPRRYVFHQNPEKPEMPLIEIEIPIHK